MGLENPDRPLPVAGDLVPHGEHVVRPRGQRVSHRDFVEIALVTDDGLVVLEKGSCFMRGGKMCKTASSHCQTLKLGTRDKSIENE